MRKLVILLETLALFCTDPVSTSGSKTDCGVHRNVSCIDTAQVVEAGDTIRRITYYKAAQNILWEQVYINDSLDLSRTYRHHYYAVSLRDSALIWFDTLTESDTAIGGAVHYFYNDTGVKSRERYFDAQHVPYREVRYDPDGTVTHDGSLLHWEPGFPCTPATGESCRDTVGIRESATDTVRRIRVYDAANRTYADLYYDNGWLRQGSSFLHLFDTNGRDSVVYWLSEYRESGVAYYGWATYHYNAQGTLLEERLFNEFDGRQYGYIRYDESGRVHEQMEDGFVRRLDAEGLVVNEFFIGRSDSTIYIRNDTGGVDTLIRKDGDAFINRTVYTGLDDSLSAITEVWDSLHLLDRVIVKDTLSRIVRIEEVTATTLDSIITFTYRMEPALVPETKTVVGVRDDLLYRWHYDSVGLVIYRTNGDGSTDSCSLPLSRYGCESP